MTEPLTPAITLIGPSGEACDGDDCLPPIPADPQPDDEG